MRDTRHPSIMDCRIPTSPRCELGRDVVLLARQFGDRLDRDEQAVGQPDVGWGGTGRRRIGHVAGVDLVEPGEVLDIGVEDRCLDHVGLDAPAAPSTAARLTSAWSVWASMPSGIVPVAGSIPAMPEQKTKPPAAIAWLYGPSATGASSLDTASLVIGRLLWWMASQRSRGPIRPGTRAALHELPPIDEQRRVIPATH